MSEVRNAEIAVTLHDGCADFLRRAANSPRNPMHGLRGVMVVSESRPAITVPEFPPYAARCPHGFVFWTYPDGARVAALRDLNYPNQGQEADRA